MKGGGLYVGLAAVVSTISYVSYLKNIDDELTQQVYKLCRGDLDYVETKFESDEVSNDVAWKV